MFDVLIRGGTIVDGSGGVPFQADLGISGSTIEAVDRLDRVRASRVIEASGLTVAPGFIDTHAHSDAMLLADRQHAAKLCQGVTTEILGQDGLSYAPLGNEELKFYRRYLAGLNGDPDIDWDWSSVAEFRARFDGTVAINTAYLVPHGAVRLQVVGMRDVPLADDELRRAQDLIDRGLADGAVGFSTGLSYYPASYADTQELVELCRTVAAAGSVYVTHLRSVFRGAPFDPVDEAIEIARRSGAALHVSHFRTRPSNAGHVAELLAPFDAAQADGLDVSLECYPYPSGSTTGLMFLPPWAHEGDVEAIVARLEDPEQRRRILADMPAPIQGADGSWNSIVLSHLASVRNRSLVGRSVQQAAELRGSTAEDVLCQLLAEERLAVGFWGTPPGAEIWERIDRDVMELFARPNYMLGSDSIEVGERPHPRGFGAFPRLLGRLRRRYGEPPLWTLVNRVTAVPARRFGLKDRGTLEPGKAADVVIFDDQTLEDTATYEDPRSLPIGVSYVLVNGKVAVDRGVPTGVLAGKAIP